MELYIGQEEVAHDAKVDDLEIALDAVRRLGGTWDLCLQKDENSDHLIFSISPAPSRNRPTPMTMIARSARR